MKKRWIVLTLCSIMFTLSATALAEETTEVTTENSGETSALLDSGETVDSTTNTDQTDTQEAPLLKENQPDSARQFLETEYPEIIPILNAISDEELAKAVAIGGQIGYQDLSSMPILLQKIYGEQPIPKEAYDDTILSMGFEDMKNNLNQVRVSLEYLFDVDGQKLNSLSDESLMKVIDFASKNSSSLIAGSHSNLLALAIVIRNEDLLNTALDTDSHSNLILYKGMTLKGPKEVQVGDKGTFDISVTYDVDLLDPDDKIIFDGAYFFDYDQSLISIDSNGNWEALKAGKVDISYGYIPSEKMLNDIIVKTGKENLTVTDTAPTHSMTILEKTTLTSTSDSAKATGKDLPNTGEQQNKQLLLIGGLVVVIVLLLIFRNKKQQRL